MEPAGQPEPRVNIFKMALLLCQSQATGARESRHSDKGSQPMMGRAQPSRYACPAVQPTRSALGSCPAAHTESTEHSCQPRAGLTVPPPMMCSSQVSSELVCCPRGKTTARESAGLFLLGLESPSWQSPEAERAVLQHAGAQPLSYLHPRKGSWGTATNRTRAAQLLTFQGHRQHGVLQAHVWSEGTDPFAVIPGTRARGSCDSG